MKKNMRRIICTVLVLLLVAGMSTVMAATVTAVESEFNFEVLFSLRPGPGGHHQMNPGETVITINLGGEHSGQTIVGARWCDDDIRIDYEGVNIYFPIDGWEARRLFISRPEGGDLYAIITPPRGWMLAEGQNYSYTVRMPYFGPISDFIRWYLVPATLEHLIAEAPNLNTASNWARDGINNAMAAGLVPGQLQSHYRNNITRAEFTALAVTLYETITGREIEGRVSFADTIDVNVQKAAYIGVVDGTGGDNFSPDMQFNREQAATILSRLAYAIGQSLPQAPATFADNAQISSWAINQVGQVQAAGIMDGVGDNTFNPRGTFTREQSILTIFRLFEFLD